MDGNKSTPLKQAGKFMMIFALPDAAPGSHLAMVKFVFKGNTVYRDTVRIRIAR